MCHLCNDFHSQRTSLWECKRLGVCVIGSLIAHELAVLPLAFVHAPRLVYEFAIAGSLTIQPIANVVVTVGVDEPAEAVIDIVLELAFVDDVIDFLADACDLAVRAKLSDDILVVAALPELSVLVNLFLRVLHDILKTQRTKFVPLVFRGFERNSVGILRPHIVERIVVSGRSVVRWWAFRLHNRLWWTHCAASHLVGFRKRLGCLIRNNRVGQRHLSSGVLACRNLPEVKLLEEVDLIVGVNELWEDLSIVSEVVDQELERLSITIQEHFLVNFLQLVQTIEHFFQS